MWEKTPLADKTTQVTRACMHARAHVMHTCSHTRTRTPYISTSATLNGGQEERKTIRALFFISYLIVKVEAFMLRLYINILEMHRIQDPVSDPAG